MNITVITVLQACLLALAGNNRHCFQYTVSRMANSYTGRVWLGRYIVVFFVVVIIIMVPLVKAVITQCW